MTQIHGLGLSRLTRWVIASLFLVSLIFVYSKRGWSHINEVLRIPVINYLLVFLLAGLVALLLRLTKKKSRVKRHQKMADIQFINQQLIQLLARVEVMLLIQHKQSQTSIPLFLSIILLILVCLLILDYSYSLYFLNNKLTKNAPDINMPIQNAVINVVLNSISMFIFFSRQIVKLGTDKLG